MLSVSGDYSEFHLYKPLGDTQLGFCLQSIDPHVLSINATESNHYFYRSYAVEALSSNGITSYTRHKTANQTRISCISHTFNGDVIIHQQKNQPALNAHLNEIQPTKKNKFGTIKNLQPIKTFFNTIYPNENIQIKTILNQKIPIHFSINQQTKHNTIITLSQPKIHKITINLPSKPSPSKPTTITYLNTSILNLNHKKCNYSLYPSALKKLINTLNSNQLPSQAYFAQYQKLAIQAKKSTFQPHPLIPLKAQRRAYAPVEITSSFPAPFLRTISLPSNELLSCETIIALSNHDKSTFEVITAHYRVECIALKDVISTERRIYVQDMRYDHGKLTYRLLGDEEVYKVGKVESAKLVFAPVRQGESDEENVFFTTVDRFNKALKALARVKGDCFDEEKVLPGMIITLNERRAYYAIENSDRLEEMVWLDVDASFKACPNYSSEEEEAFGGGVFFWPMDFISEAAIRGVQLQSLVDLPIEFFRTGFVATKEYRGGRYFEEGIVWWKLIAAVVCGGIVIPGIIYYWLSNKFARKSHEGGDIHYYCNDCDD